MDFIKEESRIFLENEDGKIIAEITFQKIQEDVFNIDHTYVDESLRGKGIASKLVEMAVQEIKKRNGKVKATCSYAQKWLENNNIEE